MINREKRYRAHQLQELDDLLKKKFYCPVRFAEEIHKLVKTHNGMNYLDAVVHFCDLNELDPICVKPLITKPLKELIQKDAVKLHMMKKDSRTSEAKLPL